MDKISSERIQLLHPTLRAESAQILCEIDGVLTGRAKFRVDSTLRTFQEQQGLYDLGRKVKNPDGFSAKKPLGNIVTNAKPGSSLHNYGLALDGLLIIDGKTASWDFARDWDNDKRKDWDEVVSVFQKYGWEWGGSWHSFVDLPHFQKTFGHTWQQLLQLHNSNRMDKDGYVLI